MASCPVGPGVGAAAHQEARGLVATPEGHHLPLAVLSSPPWAACKEVAQAARSHHGAGTQPQTLTFFEGTGWLTGNQTTS